MQHFITKVLANMPKDWLQLTTHRLDIYEEKLAKSQFLEEFTQLYNNNNTKATALQNLPTAYDYIRLGHPLSCVLEWVVANTDQLHPENIISFDSETMPVLAVLRKNGLDNKKTRILYTDQLPTSFDAAILKEVYGYQFELQKVAQGAKVSSFDGGTIFIQEKESITSFNIVANVDFFVNIHPNLGSIVLVNGKQNDAYISEIQHVRRRETVAMTPENCLTALQMYAKNTDFVAAKYNTSENKNSVLESIKEITDTTAKPLVASSGLSMQYAIMMGLVDAANENYRGKDIKFIVPPNCYGGTNDQARRVAAAIKNVEVVDLPVDGDHDMVQSLETVLTKVAEQDGVPYIIAEIPTNPRVEVPNLQDLKAVLSKKRVTANGTAAIDSVFILDQTFCPNVHFLGENAILSSVRAISYASGSKFPSGGKCTAGYCVVNKKAEALLEKIESHLMLCDNEATPLQYEILAAQLPSMNQRIEDAYKNTLAFVNFIQANLPEAKINFVSEELAAQGFTPSVFSLDLPTKGDTAAEKEAYKRELNLKLINLMISEIPDESKFCVSYGQLKGCYWTIPATSTQGTTKEGDKDYIVRTSLSPNLDLALHKKVFLDFVKSI
ncbi:PLP-dependent aminotransferase family protein [Polaribacter aquimarinus]|uniref:Cystathionine beta-synthase n=1 Tax=Polaribacter aquimarinus TaxID=2100726 RepID=A0A2U2J9W6_9FLAO|nr:PLP-dependent transferase [Polaribacter aquimarinus]PWG05136.1 cystathionine beta-synthase [Polaribacter aquimarinus]